MNEAFDCRRCSECIGQEHHWLENGNLQQDSDPWFVCKHCDAACGSVDDENGFAEPDGKVRRDLPICDDCNFYVRDCVCDGPLDTMESEDIARGESDYEDCP